MAWVCIDAKQDVDLTNVGTVEVGWEATPGSGVYLVRHSDRVDRDNQGRGVSPTQFKNAATAKLTAYNAQVSYFNAAKTVVENFMNS